MRKTLFVLFVLLLCVSTSYSFDGMRKGFVLGGGVGFCPSAKWESKNELASSILNIVGIQDNETQAGVAVNFLIGYAWDEYNMIVYEANFAGYQSDELDRNVSQGISSASWYHYFGDKGKTIFSVLGLGGYFFYPEDIEFDPGGGVLVGGGYEFSPHWQIGLYVSGGKTEFLTADFNQSHFSITINGVAF